MNQKGGANMWWIIIGAVLALVVLVVLVFMFTDNTDRVKVGLSACFGGDCKPKGECTGSINKAVECSGNTESNPIVCCVGSDKKITTT
ncbi:hypothetical protein HQ489_01780 [Candidatus Woesearchaeota archaeon]|nr:hypothetical protein [Candidatus Woesearchaeota archaeon]